MDLNETKRKRIIPEWMKSPNNSPTKSPSKTNSRVGLKQPRPSYPAISIKRTKQSPKSVKDLEPHTSKTFRAKDAKSPAPKEDQSLKHGKSSSSSSSSRRSVDFRTENDSVSDDSYFMTVDELTAVAQEVLNEARRKEQPF